MLSDVAGNDFFKKMFNKSNQKRLEKKNPCTKIPNHKLHCDSDERNLEKKDQTFSKIYLPKLISMQR